MFVLGPVRLPFGPKAVGKIKKSLIFRSRGIPYGLRLNSQSLSLGGSRLGGAGLRQGLGTISVVAGGWMLLAEVGLSGSQPLALKEKSK